MNKTASEAVLFLRELLGTLAIDPNVEVVLAPPFTALESVRTALGPSSGIGLGAQNLHWEPQGAFTGEISGPMLRDLGCTYAILGHSERRTLFGEGDGDIRKKVRAALTNGLRPILCVGESLTERESGRTETIVTGQLTAGLSGLTTQDLAAVTIAYEPVWAIGTGRAASPAEAQQVHANIRALIAADDATIAGSTRILYGGSVKASNAEELFAMSDIDGGLIGGAALDAEQFLSIIRAAR